jgi:hypothetical protein
MIVSTVLSEPSIASRWLRKSGPTKSTRAAASLMTYAISAGASRQLTATLTTLALPPPKRTSKYSNPFLSRNATRSCATRPAARSPWATRLDRTSMSAHVIARSPLVIMGRSRSLARARRRPATDQVT